MGPISWTKHVIAGHTEPEVFTECRDCGQTLSDEVHRCRECGSPNIATYEL
jgi:uncharacterized OB-fold protein